MITPIKDVNSTSSNNCIGEVLPRPTFSADSIVRAEGLVTTLLPLIEFSIVCTLSLPLLGLSSPSYITYFCCKYNGKSSFCALNLAKLSFESFCDLFTKLNSDDVVPNIYVQFKIANIL